MSASPRSHALSCLVLAAALVGLAACSDDSAGSETLSSTPSADVNTDSAVDMTMSTDTNDVADTAMMVSAPIGDPCTDNDTCEGDFSICARQLPGGYCTESCAMTMRCDAGESCVDFEGFPFCFKSCGEDSDCRIDEGYRCLDGICNVECFTNSDCLEDGEVCNSGVCGPPPPDRALGEACSASATCLPGFCSQVSANDGEAFCTSTCETSADCANPDWRCLTLFDVEANDEAVPRCAPAARLGEACSENEGCLSGLCLVADWGGVCTEACDAGDTCTAEGWTCQVRARVVGAEDEPVVVCAPGGNSEVMVLDLPASTGPHTFQVPEGTVSFQIVVIADDPSQGVVLSNLLNPAGEVVSNGGGGGRVYPAPLRYSSATAVASVIVPNNNDPMLQPVAGEWQFGVVPTDISVRSVQVFIRRSEGPVVRTTWDLNILIAPGIRDGLTAATAVEDGYLPLVIDRLKLYWNEVGLQVGEVRYFDLPAEYLAVDTRTELDDMFRLESVNLPAGALNVFFVREISSSGGGTTFGVSGGIPGAVGVTGTAGSGVVFRVRNRAFRSGDVLAHEVGHFLGLWHVTDYVDGPGSEIFFHDVIEDTPECGADPNVSNSNDPCRFNMMYPYSLGGFPQFSPIQSRIMRESPRGR